MCQQVELEGGEASGKCTLQVLSSLENLGEQGINGSNSFISSHSISLDKLERCQVEDTLLVVVRHPVETLNILYRRVGSVSLPGDCPLLVAAYKRNH